MTFRIEEDNQSILVQVEKKGEELLRKRLLDQ